MDQNNGGQCAVGRIINVRLAEHGWRQADLARVLRVSVSYISAIITGRKRVGARTAMALGAALDLDPVSLMAQQAVECLHEHPSNEGKLKAVRVRAAALHGRREA